MDLCSFVAIFAFILSIDIRFIQYLSFFFSTSFLKIIFFIFYTFVVYEPAERNFIFLACREHKTQKIYIFMLQSTHKMANLTQNEICAVLCSKRQYKQHDGEKMAMWNSAHCRFIKLWKSNTNTTETFTKHVLPAKVRAINRLKNTNHRTRKRQEWGGGGLRKNFCVSTRSRTRHPLYDDQ